MNRYKLFDKPTAKHVTVGDVVVQGDNSALGWLALSNYGTPPDTIAEFYLNTYGRYRVDPVQDTIPRGYWIKLAEAVLEDDAVFEGIRAAGKAVLKEHKLDADFVEFGIGYNAQKIRGAVEDVLGEDFCYFAYDCGADFDMFNEQVTFDTPDGDRQHPHVQTLSDLYDFTIGEGDYAGTRD